MAFGQEDRQGLVPLVNVFQISTIPCPSKITLFNVQRAFSSVVTRLQVTRTTYYICISNPVTILTLSCFVGHSFACPTFLFRYVGIHRQSIRYIYIYIYVRELLLFCYAILLFRLT